MAEAPVSSSANGARRSPTPHVTLESGHSTSRDEVAAVLDGAQIILEPNLIVEMDAAFHQLSVFAEDAPVYGVSTGFGPMVSTFVAKADRCRLQENLLRSHAVGLGEPLEPLLARAVLFARLRTLTENASAIRSSLALRLTILLNYTVAPIIPRKGGVGASGDLVQLAHLGLLLMGDGDAFVSGKRVTAATALADAGLDSWRPVLREGLALVNGTSAMTGIALVVCRQARRILAWCIAQSCMIADIIRADQTFISGYLHAAKKHHGQQAIAELMRTFLRASHADESGERRGRGASRPLQENYSIRCVPQILGPVVECLDFVEDIVYRELNSASDNPIVDSLTGVAYHGGNFHGEYVAFAMDMLKISFVKCSLLMERQLNFLLNDAVNKMLPPFLNLGTLGVELGLQGAQFTATSSAATNQTLAFPMSIHSISCNKDNQDVVSMGTNAALLAIEVLDNGFDIAGILVAAVSQALEAAGAVDDVCERTREVMAKVRGSAPVIYSDAQVGPTIRACAQLVRTLDP